MRWLWVKSVKLVRRSRLTSVHHLQCLKTTRLTTHLKISQKLYYMWIRRPRTINFCVQITSSWISTRFYSVLRYLPRIYYCCKWIRARRCFNLIIYNDIQCVFNSSPVLYCTGKYLLGFTLCVFFYDIRCLTVTVAKYRRRQNRMKCIMPSRVYAIADIW